MVVQGITAVTALANLSDRGYLFVAGPSGSLSQGQQHCCGRSAGHAAQDNSVLNFGTQLRCWAPPMSSNWWEQLLRATWDDKQRRQFQNVPWHIHQSLLQARPLLQHQEARLQHPMSMETWVRVIIWKLMNLDSFWCVATEFGVGWTLAILTVHKVWEAILQQPLILQYVDLSEVIADFKHLEFPNCVGVTDRSHIPIL